jgi:hypothetical protein
VTRFYPEDDSEPTMMPPPAGLFSPVEADESLGSTRIITPRRGDETMAFPPARSPESQLDRVERQLNSLTQLVEGLRQKIDAIEAAMNRVLPR